MPGPSETLPILDWRLAEHLLAFVLLDKAWPRGRTAIERAEIGRQRNGVLVEIEALQERIATMVEPARAYWSRKAPAGGARAGGGAVTPGNPDLR